MIPIDQQIMLCDDRGELIMLASALLSSSRQIFLTNLGAETTILLFEEVLDLLKEEKIVNMVKNKKNAKLKGPKNKGSDL